MKKNGKKRDELISLLERFVNTKLKGRHISYFLIDESEQKGVQLSVGFLE